MGLQNLVGILDAAACHIADAKVVAIRAKTRFTSAYTAVRMRRTRPCRSNSNAHRRAGGRRPAGALHQNNARIAQQLS
jgi:hypothetical protein